MRIIGHGIDLVHVERIARLRDEHGGRFLERCFTPGERAHAGDGPRRDEHLAARFAAKEAVLKALGTGWSQGIGWTDVEVVTDSQGCPGVRLHAHAGRVAESRGVTGWSLSLSHTGGLAIASAIATGP